MTNYINTVSVGICVSTVLVIYEWVKFGKFPEKGCWSVFSYVFSVVVGVELFIAGIKGDSSSLPNYWQVYICISGLILTGFFIDKLLKHMKKQNKKLPVLKVTRGPSPLSGYFVNSKKLTNFLKRR